jgi:hypothetical protein
MDVENPLQLRNIPVAELVCIEVMGQPVEDSEGEITVKSYCKIIHEYFTNLLFYLFAIICFIGIFIYLIMFPL